MASVSIPTVALIASVGAQAYMSHEQGVATANADKQKARVEQDNENQKQITIRQNMLKALAAQNANALGGGLSRANTMRQITDVQNDLFVSKANSSAQVSLLDQAASNAESAGNIGAFADVAGGVSTYYKNRPPSNG